ITFPGATSFYTFSYNVYGEIDKIVLPTGGYQRFRHNAVDGISSRIQSGKIYAQANRGVVESWISASGDGTDEAHWQYSANNNGENAYMTSVIGPNGAKSERLLYIGRSFASPSTKYGYEDCRAGRSFEERTYAASGQMIRRTLIDWTMTTSQLPAPFQTTTPTRDPRAIKKIEILLDTGGNALAATNTSAYDADLNQIESKRYDYISVNQSTAQTGDINSFPLGTLLRTEETVYVVNDPDVPNRGDYRNRHMITLPSYSRIKNGSTVVAETQFKYDEAAYPILTYQIGAPLGWFDP